MRNKRKIVVVYESKSGHTKQYAEWISEELNADLFEARAATVELLQDYDLIIYGGRLYIIGIDGVKLITKNEAKLKDKHIVVWATGANPGRPEELESVWKKNFTLEQLARIKTFYLRGGFDYSKLSFKDKAFMQMMKLNIKRTRHRSQDQEELLQAFKTPVNFVAKENIQPLLAYVRSLEAE